MTTDQLAAEYSKALPGLLRYLRQKMSAEDAEDIAQDAAVAMVRTVTTSPFRGDCKFSTWITTIATRCWLMKHRNKWAAAQMWPIDNTFDVPAPDRVEGQVYRREVAALALANIPAGQLGIMAMIAAGYQIKEIAALRGCHPGTVKSQTAKGRAKLRCLVSSTK